MFRSVAPHLWHHGVDPAAGQKGCRAWPLAAADAAVNGHTGTPSATSVDT
jgi:hypothetical protein